MHIQACSNTHHDTHTLSHTHTLWKAAWLSVKGSLLKTGPGRESWSPAKQDSYKVEHGRPRHVCRDLKPLSRKLCLHFVHCSSWTVHRKALSYPFSVHSFSLFTFSDLAAFWQLIQFLCTKGNYVLNWIIGSFLQMSAHPPTQPQTLNSPLAWAVRYVFPDSTVCGMIVKWEPGSVLQFNTI